MCHIHEKACCTHGTREAGLKAQGRQETSQGPSDCHATEGSAIHSKGWGPKVLFSTNETKQAQKQWTAPSPELLDLAGRQGPCQCTAPESQQATHQERKPCTTTRAPGQECNNPAKTIRHTSEGRSARHSGHGSSRGRCARRPEPGPPPALLS